MKKTVAIVKDTNPFIEKVVNSFEFIKPTKVGANDFRFDAGKNIFSRNMQNLKDESLKMHVFYISPILYCDTFFLFNSNQEKRTQWVEVGFFDTRGQFGTICLYDNGIKSLYNCIKEMPEDVVVSQDDNGGVFCFATIEFSAKDKQKVVDEKTTATYYVPVFKHLKEFPEGLAKDYKALFENPENAPTLFALMNSYKLPTAARFDRETKQPISNNA